MEPFHHNFNLDNYRKLLKSYITTEDETSLYQAELFSKLSMQHNILPEEIINIHIQALRELYPDLPKEIDSSLNFLLETMISYGLAYQEFQTLREKQGELESEISIAANMQQTLLSTHKPKIMGLDIGAVSVPANIMNGDYYHFVTDENGNLGIAIADVIGKGIPAALAMSMIKYSLDSFPETQRNPSVILENLNRVVERNVDTGMFITMFYGLFHAKSNLLQFASAGHEPGFYYCAKEDKFFEIKTKGIVLGVTNDTTYEQFEIQMEPGDVVILLTDGVTECRVGDRFIDTDEMLEVIREYLHLPAQEAVERVFRHFEKLQGFHLRDDFTLIFLKK
ncbi:sigma-B regulation protein RsbU (phosphoserine phosphatase) [Gracilibacillus ureilyticus]|uniref:Sigma-B regulation protein RsbU (Phosphoserine phosphatase) n=1 Tax=Gracilibacillus ureilyticus TaxID=531814 RepID=A0A1H9NR98_9BACI|nr:PP2C family protein-serine/threonine phosphatase [Gracilibacillus ureilyticus]SER38277.1 sigma-B regulation protein RsbU (phosphoserine phosphatase) [Gracilibacillus ureilyticus]